MFETRIWRRAAALLAAAGLSGSALAQGSTQFVIDRGLTDDPPYTAIYPLDLQSIDDENAATILTLVHPDAVFRCDIFVEPSNNDAWSADTAVAEIDIPAIESTWIAAGFTGFKVSAHSVKPFASGPALFYEGAAEASPYGTAVSVVHAEAVDAGRAYAVECVSDQAIAAEARPMIDVIVANFSTRSDGQCCIDPADDRG